ncbi:hypothetical protein EVAR_39087_1 [Eumeta japonica]|uniref:Uncharacterized protein n=1 Tax=Eumeta variegata TaxID=151549 RepID=A0A4C1WR23_EUMVA|nr:hypothetical protein EVAR_39087_1 [Eumeta japonica]
MAQVVALGGRSGLRGRAAPRARPSTRLREAKRYKVLMSGGRCAVPSSPLAVRDTDLSRRSGAETPGTDGGRLLGAKKSKVRARSQYNATIEWQYPQSRPSAAKWQCTPAAAPRPAPADPRPIVGFSQSVGSEARAHGRRHFVHETDAGALDDWTTPEPPIRHSPLRLETRRKTDTEQIDGKACHDVTRGIRGPDYGPEREGGAPAPAPLPPAPLIVHPVHNCYTTEASCRIPVTEWGRARRRGPSSAPRHNTNISPNVQQHIYALSLTRARPVTTVASSSLYSFKR